MPPTMIEQGVKDFTAASYVGILAPAATPAEIVKALEGALIKALAARRRRRSSSTPAPNWCRTH